MNYEFNKYLIYEMPNGEVVIQNDQSIVKVFNDEMKNFLLKNDTSYKKEVNLDELKHTFGENFEEAIKFMLKYKIIQEEQKLDFKIKSLTFISNSEKVISLFNKVYEDEYSKKIPLHIINLNESETFTINENSCVVVFLNPYNKKVAKKIKDLIDDTHNTMLITSYTYNNNFYIDCLYNKDWKNPCHFCHIGFLESKLRSDEGHLSYQQLIDMIYEEDNRFSIETPINERKGMIISILLHEWINKYINNQRDNSSYLYLDEYLNCLSYNFDNNAKNIDTAIHWELCDCYE